jgi:hypothetical protein
VNRRLDVKKLALAFLVLTNGAWAAKTPLTVTAGDVSDRRRNDGFFARLEIELNLAGEGLDGVKGARALTTKAVDDTGRDLISAEEKEPEYETPSGSGAPRLKLKLKNPARRATAVKEIAGRAELFMPAKDANATARADRFLSQVDKPISAPALKAAKVDVMVVSRKTYDEEKKKGEESRKKESEAAGAAGKMAEAFAGLFSGMFGEIGENDLLVKIDDPGKKVFGLEVVDAAGKEIEGRGRMKVGGFWILNYGAKLPADASLRIYLLTPKALVSVPFTLTNVALP